MQKRPAKYTTMGGQALLEGIMMRGPKKTVAAFCDPKGHITTQELNAWFLKEKYPILGWPFIRGTAAMIDSLRIGLQALNLSADKYIEAGGEQEEPDKFELWLNKHFGEKSTSVIMTFAAVLGVILAIVLFMGLPAAIFNGIDRLCGGALSAGGTIIRSVFEGILRILIFIGYIYLCSKVPDVRRTFAYHGAEHKTIFCYEYGLPLNVENVKKMGRCHPRCGTSFLVLMLLVGIVVGFFIPFTNVLLRTLCKILLIPLVMGIGYELIRLCGKYDNALTRYIAAPGLWLQHITTKEPDENMIKAAIVALTAVMPEDDPALQNADVQGLSSAAENEESHAE